MADRSSAALFADIFDMLAESPTPEHKSIARKLFDMTGGYDFQTCQMGCDEALVKLGFEFGPGGEVLDFEAVSEPEPPPDRERLLGEALRKTLVRAGAIAVDTSASGPELLAAAAHYASVAPNPTRIAFDIGGVLSKYPEILRPFVASLLASPGALVYVISDIKPHAKAVSFCHDNGFLVPPERIHSCDYDAHGELCKARRCAELGIDILMDDFVGYVAEGCAIRLLVMPDARRPYYADEWKTDGSEGNFGRRSKVKDTSK